MTCRFSMMELSCLSIENTIINIDTINDNDAVILGSASGSSTELFKVVKDVRLLLVNFITTTPRNLKPHQVV